MTQHHITRATLIAGLHADLVSRVQIDGNADYTRGDGDTRDSSGLPAIGRLNGTVDGHRGGNLVEIYNAWQAEAWLTSYPAAIVICAE